MVVVLMNGCACVGKSTVVGTMRCLFQKRIKAFSHILWAKEVVLSVKGEVDKDARYRQLLEDLEYCFKRFDDHSFKTTIQAIVSARKDNYDAITIDIRDPDEMKKIYKWCLSEAIPCYIVTVRRESAEIAAKKLGRADNLWSEVRSDFTVYNNGTLVDLVHEIVGVLGPLLTGVRRKGVLRIPAEASRSVGGSTFLSDYFDKLACKVVRGNCVEYDAASKDILVEAYSVLFDEPEVVVANTYLVVEDNGMFFIEKE